MGIHPGFGLTHTLPALIGPQRAQWLFYTGGRIKGDEAVAIGLADRLVEQDQVRDTARAMAREIAAAAPLAVVSLRQTLRMGLAERVRAAEGTYRALVDGLMVQRVMTDVDLAPVHAFIWDHLLAPLKLTPETTP